MEIIAEIGQNHNGDIDLALQLIREAKKNGADVAKFQLFDAKALFPTKEQGNEWFDYNCKTEITKPQLARIVEECKKNDIEFMTSVFDIERIAWCEEVGMKRYKVASRSIRDHKMIEAIAATGKPMLASLGQWHEKEFPKIQAKGGVEYLYCISKYPTELKDLKLAQVDFSRYGGFSDHTLGLTAPMAAFARGAKIVEKHFTLDKNMYGPDHQGSMTPAELKALSEFRDGLKECL